MAIQKLGHKVGADLTQVKAGKFRIAIISTKLNTNLEWLFIGIYHYDWFQIITKGQG